MKKNVIFITLLLLLLTVTAFGQSTYLLPWPGQSHHYVATVTDAGNNNPVRWYVATDALGASKASYGTDYTFVTSGYSGVNDQLEGTAVYDVEIAWGSGVAASTNYYVFLEVDDDVTACTNKMAVQVEINASFNALVYDVTGSSTPGTVVPGPSDDIEDSTCPEDVVNPLWNGSGHTDIGQSEIVYRIDRQNSVLAWQFGYSFTENTSQSFTIENLRIVDETGTQIYSGTNSSGTINVDSDENYVLVYATVTNQQDVELDLLLSLITAGDLTKDSGDNLDTNIGDNIADHTIQRMPAITGFGGN